VFRIRDPVFFLSLIRDRKMRVEKTNTELIQIQDQGSGMNMPELIFENLVSFFWVKNT
jgi:hypothetical protein